MFQFLWSEWRRKSYMPGPKAIQKKSYKVDHFNRYDINRKTGFSFQKKLLSSGAVISCALMFIKEPECGRRDKKKES